MQPYRFEFTSTPDDFGQCYLAEFMSDNSGQLLRRVRKQRLFQAALFAIIMPLAALGILIVWSDLRAGNLVGFGTTAFAVGAVVVLGVSLPGALSLERLRRSALGMYVRSIRKPPGFGSTGPTRFEVTEDGLFTETRWASGVTRWELIKSVDDSAERVVVSFHNDRMWLIPRNAQTINAGLDVLVEQLKARVLPDSEQICIAAFASDAGLGCAKCGSPVGDKPEPRCTSCGAAVSMAPLLAPWKDTEQIVQRL